MTGQPMEAERAALVTLLRARPAGATWPEITAEVLERGSAMELWNQQGQADLFSSGPDDLVAAAQRDIRAWTADGTRMLTILDADYPERLRGIHQAPPVLFVRGHLRQTDRAVSIVGSRAASEAGLKDAAAIARAVVDTGVTVASGLALGIDTAAHTAALAAGGRTVAFLGTGIHRSYPQENGQLQDEISAKGLIVSQFWPDAPPQKHNFPMRNAVMSGYGLATVVVEAGETSGSRAQARMAVEHGRPVILADRVFDANRWARALASQPGVHVASSVSDIIAIVSKLDSDDRGESPLRETLQLMLA
jgi:DNA processing protein